MLCGTVLQHCPVGMFPVLGWLCRTVCQSALVSQGKGAARQDLRSPGDCLPFRVQRPCTGDLPLMVWEGRPARDEHSGDPASAALRVHSRLAMHCDSKPITTKEPCFGTVAVISKSTESRRCCYSSTYLSARPCTQQQQSSSTGSASLAEPDSNSPPAPAALTILAVSCTKWEMSSSISCHRWMS